MSPSDSTPDPYLPRQQVPLLLTSVFIIAICGILYELLISTISSYFQGSSVLHFSLVIGLFLSFMGVGSYLSRFIERDLLTWFIRFEIWLSIIGGASAVILYFAFSLTPYFYGVAFLLIGALGSLIGVEIPILTRIVRRRESLRDAMAKVLSFDYLGSLIASVAFPLILLPTLGTMRTAFVIGLLNLAVAALNAWTFRADLSAPRRLFALCAVVALLLTAGFGYSFQLVRFFDQFLYQDQILYTQQSAYQHLVMTRWNDDLRLFIDGNIQFSSLDEYRYHEPLVHVPMLLAQRHGQVLILGGGDGLAAREVLRHAGVDSVILVDLDPAMTRLGRTHPALVRLNDSALHDPRVRIVNQDAFQFVAESRASYDVVLIDLPDPNHPSLGKLYSQSFYRLVQRRLGAGGMVITQSTSPYFAPEAFWCIHHTLASVWPGTTLPMTVYVPSFGQWGFNLARQGPATRRAAPLSAEAGPVMPLPEASLIAQASAQLQAELMAQPWADTLRFLNPGIISTLFAFDEDMQPRPTVINRLDDQKLLQYYEESWDAWR